MREPIRVVPVAGSAGERGYQHGQALAAAIERLYDQWMRTAAAHQHPIPERDLVSYATSHLPESRVYVPDLVEEAEGIAAGAALPFEKVWFLNCFDEAGNYRRYRQQNAWTTAARRCPHACSAFAAAGQSTSDGRTYLAQNWDISEWYDSVLLEIGPGGGEIGALVYTHPGVVGGTGINANGVTLVWNSLHARDLRTGVPCTLLVRKALQQPKLSDAVAAVIGGVRAIGFNFILGAEFGAVNVEATATRHRLRYIGRHYAHANHYAEPELLPFEGNPAGIATSFVKGGRMQQRLDEAAGEITLEICQRILQDHANHPSSICVHKDPASGRSDSHTQASLIYVPAERLLLASDGPPCENPYEEYRVGRGSE